MIIENGGEQPANDAALTVNEQPNLRAALAEENAEQTEGENTEGEEGQQQAEPEWAEIEIDGKKYRVEAAAKDGYLRQADYSRKTMEVAEARKALDADREGFVKQTEAQKAHFATATKLAAVEDRMAEYSKVDWSALYLSNPDLYQQHRIAYDQLKDQRDAVARDFSEKERTRIENENRESGTRVQKVQAEIARLIPEWTPGGELDLKLQRYGNGLGFSNEDLAQTTLRNPKFVQQLKRLHDFDEAAKKTKTQQTFEKTQAAQPVTRVGGNGGSANQRKTTDSSGDTLPAEEWAKRETERVRKQATR